MTFLEAALHILAREGKPLHFKELTERALGKKLLTFVGRTPEVTMQTQLTAAVKKAPGNPFVRVKPGVFGLLRYPEVPPEEPAAAEAPVTKKDEAKDKERGERPEGEGGEGGGRGRRRRRRGGRGRGREDAPRTDAAASGGGPNGGGSTGGDDEGDDTDEPSEPKQGGLSAEARAAALAETGVLEGDDDDSSGDDEGEESMSEEEGAASAAPGAGDDVDAGGDAGAAASADASVDDAEELEGDDEGDDEGPGGDAPASADAGPGGEAGGRRRRRRRRRRGGGGDTFGEGAPRMLEAGGEAPTNGEGAPGASVDGGPSGEPRATDAAIEAEAQGPRRIMTPVDAAIEVLRGHPPGRGIAVRQIGETAARRRLVHGAPEEAWRVMRAALAAEPRERLRAGLRPRVRSAGAGLYSLARRPPDAEVERAELVFGEARRALRERTLAALERRIADLPPPAFEALARVLLQREGFGPATFVKRIETTIYIEALRGRGSRPSRVLVALRAGGTTAGRRAVGELRAGIVKRGQEEGLLMLAGRLGDDAIAEWKKPARPDGDGQPFHAPPIEIADGQAMAETCVRHGIGVVNANVSVDFVDADFFADLAES